jgi:hypothetical protein
VANEQHIERVKLALEHLHNCGAIHCATVPVHEVFRGQTVWQGDVEVFDLTGHPKAKRAYGWSETPPIKSAMDAVRASIVADAKKQKRRA